MKKIVLILMLTCFFKANAQTENPNYDSKLAASLGGDDYGMKMYILAILKAGSNKTTDKDKLNELFKGHMDNINRLAKDGKLIVAGPLKKNDQNYRGIFILNAKTIEEANELLLTDPAIKEKLFEVEIFEWYGSAALPEYLKIHEKIEKKKH
ncbi:YciI family protein [Flavobacterium microcysteis]